jgi:hypothetical protein
LFSDTYSVFQYKLLEQLAPWMSLSVQFCGEVNVRGRLSAVGFIPVGLNDDKK